MVRDVATKMLQRLEETGHPFFTSVSVLSRGILKRLKNKEIIHLSADASNTELLFRIIHCANQLSIYGAVSSRQPSPNETEPISEKFVTCQESDITETLKSVNSQEIALWWILQGRDKSLETGREMIFWT